MRVAHLIGSAQIGGAERQLVRLAVEQRRRGIDVEVHFISGGGPLTDVLDEAGVPWQSHHKPLPRGLWLLAAPAFAGRFNKVVRQSRPDVLHLWLPQSVVWGAAGPLPKGTAIVAGVRGRVPFERGLSRLLYRRGLRRAHAVVANSQALADRCIQDFGAPASRVRVINNGLDIPPYTASAGMNPPRGVVVANFHHYKGYDVLVEALRILRSQQRDAGLLVRCCGSGAVRDLVALQIRELGLEHCLELVDIPADVPAELAQAQLGIHPSRTEGFPNAVLEELAAGLPVIACAVGGNVEIIQHGQNGLLIPPGDADALADAITELSTDPELRAQMGAAARRSVMHLDWQTCSDRYVALYESLISTICHD